MKRNILFAAVFTLFVMAVSASAQKAATFSGTWTLDVSKSKLGERNMIESQTLTVTQTDKDIKIATATKRAAPPEGAPGGGGAGGRLAGGMGMGPAENTISYNLDGKEVAIEQETPRGKVPTKMTGKVDGGKLSLTTSRTFQTPNGEMTQTTKETWSLSADGNTLTIDREQSSQRGSASTTSVYTRKP
jgi:hypothetical protein